MAVLSTLLSKRLGTVVAQGNMARMVNIVNMDMVNIITHSMVIGRLWYTIGLSLIHI